MYEVIGLELIKDINSGPIRDTAAHKMVIYFEIGRYKVAACYRVT